MNKPITPFPHDAPNFTYKQLVDYYSQPRFTFTAQVEQYKEFYKEILKEIKK